MAPGPNFWPRFLNPIEEVVDHVLATPLEIAVALPRTLEELDDERKLRAIANSLKVLDERIFELPTHLDNFAKALAALERPDAGFEQRRRVRAIFLELRKWISTERDRRMWYSDPNPPPSWTIAGRPLQLMEELRDLGVMLRGTYQEAHVTHSAATAELREKPASKSPGKAGRAKRKHEEAPTIPAPNLELRSQLALLNDSQREVIRELFKAVQKGDGLTLDELTKATKANNRSTVERAIGELESMGFPIPNKRNGAGYSLRGKSLKAAQELVRMDAETTPKRH